MQRKEGCEVCGNDEDRCFEVHLGGERHFFDSFECAIAGLMPKCQLCGSLLLNPGMPVAERLYCSNGCASFSVAGEEELHLFTTDKH